MNELVWFKANAEVSRDGNRVRVRIPQLSGMLPTDNFFIFVTEYDSDAQTTAYTNLCGQLEENGISLSEDGIPEGETIEIGTLRFALTKDKKGYIRLVVPRANAKESVVG